jgi:soluble lytic murein transglycosylase-like protein
MSRVKSAIRVATLVAWGLTALGLATVADANGIVKWVDANGITHYSNVPGDRARANGGATKIAVTPAEQSRSARASVYKYRDAQGVLHYTDQRPQNRRYITISVYCPACDPRSTVNWDRTRLNTNAYNAEIAEAAARWSVDPALVRAIIHAESSFNPEAESHKGAQGLMQLMPATARMYGVTNAFDAVQNIQAGVQHLAMLLTRYRGDVRLASAAYNAGEGAVKRYGGVPPYDDTKVYVERVGVLHRRYQSGG